MIYSTDYDKDCAVIPAGGKPPPPPPPQPPPPHLPAKEGQTNKIDHDVLKMVCIGHYESFNDLVQYNLIFCSACYKCHCLRKNQIVTDHKYNE